MQPLKYIFKYLFSRERKSTVLGVVHLNKKVLCFSVILPSWTVKLFAMSKEHYAFNYTAITQSEHQHSPCRMCMQYEVHVFISS